MTANSTNTIVVNASASTAGGIGAHFNLVIDGTVMGSAFVNSATSTGYTFQTALAAGIAHDIKIAYDNDVVINGQDRNLFLQSVSVNGTTTAATSSTETYYPTGLNPVASSGTMLWNGVADFAVPASAFPLPPVPTSASTSGPTNTIVVNASADLAGGVGAHFNLVVDGSVVGNATVNSATSTGYTFQTALATGVGHDIKVVYDNDAIINGQDRNLFLQSVSVNGTINAATGSMETYYPTGLNPIASSGTMLWNGAADFSVPASEFAAATSSTTPTSSGTTTSTSPSSTIIVGGNSQYSTIQAGIQAAKSSGSHILKINPGTYSENETLGAANNGLAISTVSGGVTLVGSVGITSASNISISGISFQGNGGNVAVMALNSNAITITGDRFVGANQDVVLDGTGNSTVSGNVMTNTAASAIEARNGANWNTISNNVITGDNAPDTIGAIWLHGTSNTGIVHNQITNTTGAAISLSDFYGPGTTATQNINDTVAYNYVNNVDTQSSDSGAIYFLGRSQALNTGNVVKMNFIGATGSPGAHAVGIYLDDNMSGVSVTGNIVAATPTMSDVFQIHGGSNNSFSGNIFDLGTGSTSFGLAQQAPANVGPQGTFLPLTNDIITGNVYTTESTAPRNPGFANLTGGVGNVSISGNDFWSFSGVGLNVGGTGANGDSGARYTPPAMHAATTSSDYAGWGGAGINFHPIDTSLIGVIST